MSERQDKPLGGRNEQSIKVLDNIELPGWVHEGLSMGPKYPNRDKLNGRRFLDDINIFLSLLKNQKTSGETYFEIEAERHMQKTKSSPKKQSP